MSGRGWPCWYAAANTTCSTTPGRNTARTQTPGSVSCCPTCGRRGCWEAYGSATALIRQGKRAGQAHPESALSSFGDALTAKDVFDAAEQGDETAQAVLERYYVYVAAGITDLVNILGPELVLIGGGISRQGERLLAPVREYVASNCFGGHDRKPPELRAAKLGNEAGIIGAAAL